MGLNQPVRVVSIECNLPEFLEKTLLCLHRLNILNATYAYGFYAGGNDFIDKRTFDYAEAIAFVKSTNRRYFEIFSLTEK